MSYTVNIPATGQSLGNSRPQVVGNFNYINTAFAINHVAFNQVNVGKHYKVEMPRQSPSPTPAAAEGFLFTKLANGITKLIWKRDAGATDIELTNVNPTNAQKGSTFLPGGLLLQWGKVSLAAGTANVTFQETFTSGGVTANPWSITLTLANSPTTVSVLGVSGSGLSGAGFTINSFQGLNQSVYYMAIGPKT